MTDRKVLPQWLKILHTAFVCVLVPVYAVEHGWAYAPTDRLLKWWTRKFGAYRRAGQDDD